MVNETEHRAMDGLPLVQAASRLGISPDALRMRINRGKIKGYKRGGRLFAVLDGAPNPGQGTVSGASEHSAHSQSEQANQDPAPLQSPGDGSGRAAPNQRSATQIPEELSLPLVVEFQKVELTRLLRDNARLNQRFDQLMEELRHLREMQQREQVLRQQDQVLRQRAQTLIERLGAPSVAAAAVAMAAVQVPGPSAAAAPASAPLDAPPGAEAAPPADVLGSTADKAANGGEPADLPLEISSYAYDEDEVLPARPSAPSPLPPAPPPNEAAGPAEAAQRDTAELADMLEEIGTSLRELDTDAPNAAAPNPARTGPRPPPAPGDRRAPDELAGRASGPPPSPPPSPPPESQAAAPVRSEDNEASLLEILGRMGPSAEERRTAARLMQRLMKGRATRPRNDLGNDVD